MKRPLLSLILLAGSAFPCAAADFSWVGANGALWTAPGSWHPNAAYPNGLGDAAYFSNNTTTTRNVTLDDSVTLKMLAIGFANTAAAGFYTVNLSAAGQTLAIGSSTVPGELNIGSATNNFNANGTMTLVSGTLQLTGGIARVGARPDTASAVAAGNVQGTLNISNGATLRIGTQTDRSDWWIGRRNGINFHATNGGSGSVKATGAGNGGTLTAWVDDLVVGLNASTVSTGGVNENLSGSLDLSGLTAASVDTNRLDVGVSLNSSAVGTFAIGAHSVTAREAVRIGVGKAFTGTAAPNVTNYDTVTGSIAFANGADVRLGEAGVQRASLEVGTSEASRAPAANSIVHTTRTGSIAATGGTFSGHLSSVTIGSQNAAPVANQIYTATGTVDLRSAVVTHFDVAGDLIIGNGTGVGSHGTLRLPEVASGAAAVSGNLTLGDSVLESSGLLDLEGTLLSIGGDVNIDLTGRLTVTVDGASAGLVLSAGSALSIASLGAGAGDTDAGYFITFRAPEEEPTGLYTGFGWEGNQLAQVNALVSSHAITWNNLTSFEIGTFYDAGTDTTWVGVVPEPGSLLLASGGLAALFLLTRKRRA